MCVLCACVMLIEHTSILCLGHSLETSDEWWMALNTAFDAISMIGGSGDGGGDGDGGDGGGT